VEVLDATETLCDHVHLPVQSGSTAVLKAMAREYTREWYLERIAWIKAAKRDISITSDIIVGFPGETEKDLEETATLLDAVGYDAIFAFKYSPRPNTPAVSMADSISDEVKATRLQSLLDRQREIQRTSYCRHLGQILEVMVEGHNRQRNQVVGRSSQNKTVNFTLNTGNMGSEQGGLQIWPALGSYRRVRITQTFPNSLLGEMVGDAAGAR
jgi:tRNA-2-methylthio-N6-dimethylallyladenosine synthase